MNRQDSMGNMAGVAAMVPRSPVSGTIAIMQFAKLHNLRLDETL